MMNEKITLELVVEAPAARIVIDIRKDGSTHLGSEFAGRFDSSYGLMGDRRLLTKAVPELLDELRAQILGSSQSSVIL